MSRKYATLALVQNAGGAYTQDATISLAITPSLQIKHDSIVICRWGVEAKHEASPNTRWRDAPNASGRLTSFSVEGRESRALPRSSWRPSLMQAVCVCGRHFNCRQPSGLNKNNLSDLTAG